MPVCQIAISTTHLLRTHHWYRRALGFLPAGELRHREAPGPGRISDLPESSLDVWCLMGQQDWFQFEMFEFQRPRMRMLPSDWRPCDIGYSMVGVHVTDFDEALDRLLRTSGRPLSDPVGEPGGRRVCLRDPEGVLLELMEDNPRSFGASPWPRQDLPVAVRSLSLSVADLDRAHRSWTDGLGLVEATGVVLHSPEHEALWDLAGATRRTVLLWAGDFLVELVQYEDPRGRQRPAGYLLSDQGLLNVALGTLDRDVFDRVYHQALAAGFQSNSDPWTLANVGTVAYLLDEQGSCVELMHVESTGLEHMGFIPWREHRP